MSRARLWTCLSLFIYRIFPTCLYPALFSFFLYPTSFTVFLPFSGIFTLLFWYFPLLFWYFPLLFWYFPPPILVFFPSYSGIFPLLFWYFSSPNICLVSRQLQRAISKHFISLPELCVASKLILFSIFKEVCHEFFIPSFLLPINPFLNPWQTRLNIFWVNTKKVFLFA